MCGVFVCCAWVCVALCAYMHICMCVYMCTYVCGHGVSLCECICMHASVCFYVCTQKRAPHVYILIYSLVYSHSYYSSQDNNHSRCRSRQTQLQPLVNLRLLLNQYGAAMLCKKRPCHLPNGPTSSLFGSNRSRGNCLCVKLEV